MECLDISNVQLASEIHLDPSYISKLRNGKRKLPAHPDFLEIASEYFVEETLNKNQEEVMAKILQTSWPKAKGEAVELIHRWLRDEYGKGDLISNLLYQISHSGLPQDLAELPDMELQKPAATDFYYGREGKRQAVIRFFEEILSEEGATHMKLFSDENMLWMLEKKEFSRIWGAMFSDCLKKGSKVTIIHNLSRNLDELIESLIRWLPVYMTGKISPYYFPRKRDGIFERTLFIAEDLAAISSNALTHNSDGMLNLYLKDRDAVAALELEFDRYLELCRPLMNIVNDNFASEYPKLYQEVLSGGGDIYYRGAYPSFISLPESLALEIDRMDPSFGFYAHYVEARGALFKVLEEHKVHVMINLPKKDEPAPLQQGIFLGAGSLLLNEEQRKRHYREILRLAREYDHYKVYLDKDIDPKLSVFLRTEAGVVVERGAYPPTLFGITEGNMVSAFYYYLDDGCRFARIKEKDGALEILEEYCK